MGHLRAFGDKGLPQNPPREQEKRLFFVVVWSPWWVYLFAMCFGSVLPPREEPVILRLLPRQAWLWLLSHNLDCHLMVRGAAELESQLGPAD